MYYAIGTSISSLHRESVSDKSCNPDDYIVAIGRLALLANYLHLLQAGVLFVYSECTIGKIYHFLPSYVHVYI